MCSSDLGLSLVVASGGYSLLRSQASHCSVLLRSTGSRCVGFSSCGAWAQQLQCVGSVFAAHGL